MMETAYLSAYAFQQDWPLDHSKLRQEVVAYLRRFQTQFKDWFDNQFRSFDLAMDLQQEKQMAEAMALSGKPRSVAVASPSIRRCPVS